MCKSHNHDLNLIAYLLLPGGSWPRFSARNFPPPSPTPFLHSKAHADRGIRTPTSVDHALSTASSPATAPPTAGTPLATGSTTAAGRSTAGRPARSGTASRSSPHGTSRTPSAAATASGPGVPRACRGSSGNSSAAHAFSVQANDAITMYAQLLTRLSTGAVKACTPPLSCAITFSWSQRSLALKTISSAARGAIVGDEEEVAILLAQPHRRPCRSPAACGPPPGDSASGRRRAIIELGDHLLERVDRLESPLADDLGLDVLGSLPRRRLDRVLRRPFQEAVRRRPAVPRPTS